MHLVVGIKARCLILNEILAILRNKTSLERILNLDKSYPLNTCPRMNAEKSKRYPMVHFSANHSMYQIER